MAGRPAVSRIELTIDGTGPLTAEAVAEVTTLCDRAEDGPGPGLVVVRLHGAPRAPRPAGLAVGLVGKWERALRRLERLERPTVATVAGDIGGTALDALFATDLRIAAPSARLLFTGPDGSVWPGMAVHRIAQQSGPAAARRAVLFGMPLTAGEALRLGLVDEVRDDPARAVAALAGSVPAGEPWILRRLLSDAVTMSFEDALGPHLAACDRALRRGAAT
ncbi:enoyl-CoA-hydratase DpgB [Actinomadura macrotermitis]|uniref:Enoyl-CoA-hydratase n=1 Tax=Actinomadura macrotermitis TaxID=2585200 RepID=A0A7K0BPA6_9ACTN|nr:Enoyl-CoA-hydratase [Actinomadura macrotermitis]